MEDKTIFHKLNNYWKILEKEYYTENICNIFVTSIDNNYISTIAIVIPTFEEICTSINSINKEITLEDGKIKVVDIRNVYNATKEGLCDVKIALETKYIITNPKYQHIFSKQYLANKDKINAGISLGEPADELKTALIKLCRMCWNDNSGTITTLKQLTDAEKAALDGIVKIIGDEGVFSQAKAASMIGVSRLAMTNLIGKLQKNNVAVVEYMGPQGTYLKILDDTLLNIRSI